MHTYGEPKATLVSGSGATLFDSAGRSYVDFLAGISVMSLGHSAPVVREAITRASAELQHVSNFFGNPHTIALAEALNRHLECGSGQVFFCNSGAEANEAAFKLARKWGKGARFGIVGAVNSFHGRTFGALAATGQPAKQLPFRPLPEGFSHVPYSDVGALERALEDPTVAAVILEPIMGEGGVVDPDPGYLRAVRRLTEQAGVLLIMDEVQAGMCRTGRWFGFQHEGITPDIVTMAKALGNGFPIGATWAKDEVADAFAPGDHGTTFGGSAMAGAVAMAVINEMERLDLAEVAARRGKELQERLGGLPGVRRVSGRGMLLGLHREHGDAKRVAEVALAKGLIVNALSDDIIRIAPPLVITDDELETGLARLGAAIGEVASA
jgi:predicted acetylornithine/succinylornithine family transaminase